MLKLVFLVLTASVLVTARRSAPYWVSECGESKFADAGRDQWKQGEDRYIVNGWDARPHEFPWQASLLRLGSLMCGAVVINPNWLLTAAHCVEGENAANLEVIIGDHERTGSDPDNNRQKIQVASFILHADYDITGEIENDVAVLRVNTEISFSENVQPACRPEGSYESGSGSTSGWGRTGDFAPLANILQYANNPIMEHTACHACFPNPRDILPGMLCFGYCAQNTQSTCNGDSGGPMVVRGSDDRFDVVGLTSWGMGGCLSSLPPVFTNVSYFNEWIDENIQ